MFRKGAKQADHIVLEVNSEITLGNLTDAVKDRISRTSVKTHTVIINGQDWTYTHEQITSDGFKIQLADLN